MPRYVAFLRGVSPMNLKMADLKRVCEGTGMTDVKTVLSSGNVVFSAPAKSEAGLVRQLEAAMSKDLGRTFFTVIRHAKALAELIQADPYGAFRLPANAKRVVTFLREPPKAKPVLPLERDGVRVLTIRDREIFTAYLPNPRGPVFMTMIEKTFGTDLTTRTWDTVRKCATA